MEESRDDRTLWVGNLEANKISEEILFELFLQAGPLVDVKIPKDGEGKRKNFAFIEFKHSVSVPYGRNLLNNLQLYHRPMNIRFRKGSRHESEQLQSPQMQRSSSAPAFGNMNNPMNGPSQGFDRTHGSTWSNGNQGMPNQMGIPPIQNPYMTGLPINRHHGGRRDESPSGTRSGFHINSDDDFRPSSRGSYRNSPIPQVISNDGSHHRVREDIGQSRNDGHDFHHRRYGSEGHKSHESGSRHHRSQSERGYQGRPYQSGGKMTDQQFHERGRPEMSQRGGHHRSRSHREDEMYRRDRSHSRSARR